MSRWTDPPTDGSRDGGFSLLEVVVALGILMVVVTALLPQLIVGIRATAVSNRSTVLKTVAQGEIEGLRNLPYRVSYDADPDVIDLLDRYYPNLVAPSSPSSACASGASSYTLPTTTRWTGFVAAGGMRCDFEPAAGPFFRTVTLETHAVLGEIALVTDIQFLSAGTRAAPAALTMTPRAGYDSRVPARDVPPSSQVSAAVTVLYRTGDRVRAHTAYTQIAQRLLSPTRMRSEVDVTTVEISSTREDGAALSLRAGSVNLEGALTHASTATANVAAAQGSVATGDPATSLAQYGAARTVSAPPASQIDVVNEVPPGACGLFCWGSTTLAPAATLVTTDGARPRVGSQIQPAQALITNLGNDGLRFDNAVDRSAYRPDWALDGPLVRLAPGALPQPTGVVGCRPVTGGSALLSATGYLNTLAADDASTLAEVEACAVARASTLAILPTAFAPGGVVRVTLRSAYARCYVDNGTTGEDADYDVLVEVFDGDGYTPYDVEEVGAQLKTIPVGTPAAGEEQRYLDHYLASFTSATLAPPGPAAPDGSVEIPAALTIVTHEVRGVEVIPVVTPSPSPSPLTTSPTASPTADPTASPSASPGADPTASPSASPTTSPSPSPSPTPTPEPELVLDPSSAVTISVGSVSCSAMDAR